MAAERLRVTNDPVVGEMIDRFKRTRTNLVRATLLNDISERLIERQGNGDEVGLPELLFAMHGRSMGMSYGLSGGIELEVVNDPREVRYRQLHKTFRNIGNVMIGRFDPSSYEDPEVFLALPSSQAWGARQSDHDLTVHLGAIETGGYLSQVVLPVLHTDEGGGLQWGNSLLLAQSMRLCHRDDGVSSFEPRSIVVGTEQIESQIIRNNGSNMAERARQLEVLRDTEAMLRGAVS